MEGTYAVAGYELYHTIQDKLQAGPNAWRPVREPFVEYLCDLLEKVIKGSEEPPAPVMRVALQETYGYTSPQLTRHVCDLTRKLLYGGPLPLEGEERKQYDRLGELYWKFHERVEAST
jgi:hypothetical protein